MRRKTILVVSVLAVWGLVGWLCRISFAQSPHQDRIAGPIAGSPAVWLEGNVRPLFGPENDMGPVEGSLKLENISLTFKLTESQQADLTALIAEQQDPSSPNYHHWLTPEQYADRFGLSPNDIHQVVAWLQAQGFQVTQTARGRTWVSFSGTAAQVQAAFQTEIHNFSLHGQTYYANASEPAVPAALADVVLGFRGLDNYRLKPRSRVRHVKSEPKPKFTSGISGNTFVSPDDFATIYDVQNLYDAGIDGTNQSIAVMGQTDLYNNGSDITDFRSAAGLPAMNLTLKLDPNSSDPGLSDSDIEEASLDVEWSGAVARKATIIYFYSNDVVNDSLYDAIDTDIAPVISISYGNCEAAWGSTALTAMAQNAQRANSQGQTIVAAAGDSGAADCDSSETSTITTATQGLAVDAPASLPYVTGMGGSEFNEGSGDYWQATTSANLDILSSALSYIPEMVWNDTSSPENTGNGLLAGGGGASTFTPPGAPSKPAWQTGTGIPSDGHRDVPDLSLNASPIHEPLLICVQGSCVNGYRNTDQTLSVVGGTSAAAPTFAGIVALINQKTASRGQSNINPILYSMAATSPAAFHDITVGNNRVPCQSGSPDCPASGEMGYSAGVGYDQASGLGSVDAYNLVMEWNSPGTGNLPAPTLTEPANGATGALLSPSFTWSGVSGNNGYRILIATSPAIMPTNPAITTCSGCTVVDTTPVNSASYTPLNALVAGTYFWQVQAIEPPSSSGNAAWSDILSFTTTGGTLPAPTLSAPANGAAALPLPLSPAFTWSTVQNSVGYRILIATTQGGLPTNPAVGTCGSCVVGTTTTAASYTPSATALDSGTTYYWEVQTLAASGSGQSGAWSTISSFTTAPPDFTVVATPSTFLVFRGASGITTISISAINGFTGTVSLTCQIPSLMTGGSCSVFPASITPTNVATLTVYTTAVSRMIGPFNSPRWLMPVGGAILTAFFLLVIPAKIRRLKLAFGLLFLVQLAVAFAACGGSASSVTSTTTPLGIYPVTVTGTSGRLVRTAIVTVTVHSPE